jgi:hypothetical protein
MGGKSRKSRVAGRSADSFGPRTQGNATTSKYEKTPLEKKLAAEEKKRQARLAAEKRKEALREQAERNVAAANTGYLAPARRAELVEKELKRLLDAAPVEAKKQTAEVYASERKEELPQRKFTAIGAIHQREPTLDEKVLKAFIDVLNTILGLLWFQAGFVRLHPLLKPPRFGRQVEATWVYALNRIAAWQEAKREYRLHLQNLAKDGKVTFDGEPLLGHFFKQNEYNLWQAVEKALRTPVSQKDIAYLAEEGYISFNEDGTLADEEEMLQEEEEELATSFGSRRGGTGASCAQDLA